MELLRNVLFELVPLVTDLVEVLIGLALQGVEEALRLKFGQALLDELLGVYVFVLAKSQLFVRFFQKRGV